MKSLKSFRLRLSRAGDLLSPSRPSQHHRETSGCGSETTALQANDSTSTSLKDVQTGRRIYRSSTSHLLNVPPEVRYIIYTYLSLDVQITETIESFALPPYKVRRKYRLSTTVTQDYAYKQVIRHCMPPITQVCTQLRSETIAFTDSRCQLTLLSQSKSRIFTPKCSWINYDMITHVRISQYSRVEMAKIRQHCKRLQSVVVDLEWKPYYQDGEISTAVERLRRHQAHLLKHVEPLANTADTDADAADVYWSAIDSFVSTHASELCCLRTDVLVLALDPHRTFELQLRYSIVLVVNTLRVREQGKALDWDTGQILALDAPVEYYFRLVRAEE